MNYEDPKVIKLLILDLEILQEQQDEEHGDTLVPTHKHAAEAIQYLFRALDLERFAHKDMRNRLAELENQSQWKCACGGTDTDGMKENAALRAENEFLASMVRGLEIELDRHINQHENRQSK